MYSGGFRRGWGSLDIHSIGCNERRNDSLSSVVSSSFSLLVVAAALSFATSFVTVRTPGGLVAVRAVVHLRPPRVHGLQTRPQCPMCCHSFCEAGWKPPSKNVLLHTGHIATSEHMPTKLKIFASNPLLVAFNAPIVAFASANSANARSHRRPVASCLSIVAFASANAVSQFLEFRPEF